ncbi:MAG: hypothetical protein J6A11_03760 [Lachnospiraceae bacterium]|nr:hypothetical protein [Lachnospiraceae bacterium]
MMKMFDNKRPDKKIVIKVVMVLAFILLVNIFVFGNLSVMVPGKYTEKTMDLAVFGDECTNVTFKPDGSVFVAKEGGCYELENIDCETKTISLVLDTESKEVLTGEILTTTDGYAYFDSKDQTFEFNSQYGSINKALISQGKLRSMKITIPESETGVSIREITFNKKQPFSFNYVTFIIMCIVSFLFLYASQKGLTDIKMDLSDKRQKMVLLLGMLLAVWMALFLCIVSNRTEDSLLYDYEEGKTEDMPLQQMMLFDALRHGSVRLNLEVNPDYLLMDNLYDNSERRFKEYEHPWDVAFYNGSYYSYFGSLPIVVFYELFYILTGYLPGVNLQMFLFMVFGIIGFFAATSQLIRYFGLKPSLFFYILGNWALMAASFFFIISSSTEVYTISIILGIGSLLWGIALGYKAVMCENKKRRMLFYILCGVALVMTVALRPPVLLMLLAFIQPPFIKVLSNPDLTVKNKLHDVLSFAVPVLLGAVVLMFYNDIRFDSPFEFGARYQLTVSDVRYNKMTWDLNNILAALYNYGFKGLDVKSRFPFLFYRSDWDYVFGKYIYQECTMGVFAFPYNLLAFGIFACSGKAKKKDLSIMTKCVFAASVFLLLFDFGMGGLVGRYAGDFAIGFSICAFLVMVYCDDAGMLRNKKVRNIVVAIIVATLLMGFLLLFSNDPIKYQIRNENPNIYLFFANLFDI